MSAKLPEKLKHPPVVEAIFELRFAPAKESVGDILVGILYSQFGGFQKIEPLPLATVPREVRDKNPNLQYLASHRLAGDGKHIIVGDRVVGFGYSPTYQGWTRFREEIVCLLTAVRKTDLVTTAERYSLKYINLLAATPQEQLSLLNARFELAGQPLSHEGFRFRTERHDDGIITIVELITGARVQLPDDNREGLLLTVDTICGESPNKVLDEPYRYLDQLHLSAKATFFGLLTDDTMNVLGPEWENESLH
jgi:uncharacterized protein (TIGR04255 family)